MKPKLKSQQRPQIRPVSKSTSRPTGRPARELPEGQFIVEGIAAVKEYLRFRPSSVKAVFVKERTAKAAREELKNCPVTIKTIDENESQVLPPTPVWAYVQHDVVTWTDLLHELDQQSAESSQFFVVLDHISDPRNLGAIVRTAAFFGHRYVIVPEKRQVLLTQASVNTAQGGFALVDLVIVVNVSRVLEELKDRGFWVLGASMDGENVASVKGRYNRKVLVLGSEDKGISTNVLSHCDVRVGIGGGKPSLESLNVSVAAGILIHGLGHN